MLDEYTKQVDERVAMGTAPLPSAAKQSAALAEFLKTTPAGVEIS